MSSHAKSHSELDFWARLSLVLFAPLSGLTLSGLGPIMTKLARHFADEPNADILVRLLSTGCTFAMIFGCLATGWLAKRLGERRLLLCALGLSAIAGSLGFVVDSLPLLLMTRLILGAATAMAGVLVIYFITSGAVPSLSHYWLGLYSFAGSIGTVILTWIAGLVGSIEWRFVFLLHLAIVPVLVLILIFVAKDRPRSEMAQVAEHRFGKDFPWPHVLLGVGVGMLGLTGHAFLPFHLSTIGIDDPSLIAIVLIAPALVSGLTAFCYGWVVKTIGMMAVFIGSFFLISVGLLIVVITSSFAGAITGMALLGAGLGCLFPNFFAVTAKASSDDFRARNLGFVRAAYYSGPLLAQLALEPIVRDFGPGGAIIALGLFGFVLIALTAAARHRLIISPAQA